MESQNPRKTSRGAVPSRPATDDGLAARGWSKSKMSWLLSHLRVPVGVSIEGVRTRTEVRTECRRGLSRRRQPDIPIRPHEIQRVSSKTRALRRVGPRELAHREPPLSAVRASLVGRTAVDVHLPV